MHHDIQLFAEYAVTPFVGVWIETLPESLFFQGNRESHPSWVCGLKLSVTALTVSCLVTPFVGVWIETYGYAPRYSEYKVTPFVGVWIETGLLDSV